MAGPTDATWTLPRELRDMVNDELASGERLLWSGQPAARPFVLKTLPIVVFGIPWTAFAIFWTVAASGLIFHTSSKPPIFFPLFGLPFVAIGVAMLSSPIRAIGKARRIVYVLTDRRAVIFERRRATRIRSFGPKELARAHRRQRRDGSGDVLFSDEPDVPPFQGDSERPQREVVGFLGIPDVQAVERMVRDVARKADARATRAKYMR